MGAYNGYKRIKAVYEVLKENEWYWEMDNDYRNKYWIVQDGAENWERISFESRPYVLDMAIFMEEIDRQIFHRDREEARG